MKLQLYVLFFRIIDNEENQIGEFQEFFGLPDGLVGDLIGRSIKQSRSIAEQNFLLSVFPYGLISTQASFRDTILSR